MNDFIIRQNVLRQYTGNEAEISLPEGISTIAEKAFEDCKHLETIFLHGRITSIGAHAFRFCEKLRSIAIPKGITFIKQSTFKGCTSLEKIDLPSSLVCIETSAFSGCKSLRSVCIPDSVNTLDWNAFFGCDQLTEITMPGCLVYALKGAFRFCPNISCIILSSGSADISDNAFACISSLKILQAPSLSLDMFKGSVKLAMARGFLLNPEFYDAANRKAYIKYLTQQRKKMLLLAVQQSDVHTLSVYEQLGISIPPTLCDELIETATTENKTHVLSWLHNYKNRTTDLKKEKKSKERDHVQQTENPYNTSQRH